VPIAEENGLIIPIGDWLLESICDQLNHWKKIGLNPAPVAVNISARQLEQRNFVKTISSILKKTNIENELLEIELTESILIQNSDKNSRKLVKLRKNGTKVAIDDFGTGYSSLAYLTNFPFDKLKIDQSFIRDIVTDKAAASLATSIISMAHRLGVRVIAEGVETKAQLNFLKDYKCDEIQGFYFSEPVPAEKFTEMLKNNSILS
jgi:EAL domain-containing protein (putative c-di-GMP-specific phosphodiesterase class I)